MKTKKRYRLLQWLMIAILVLIVMFPLYLVVISSMKPHNDIVRNPLALPLHGIFIDNFKTAWKYGNYIVGFTNSIKVVFTTILLVVIPAFLAGYSLGTKRFKTENLVKTYFLLVMTIPLQLFLFPLYGIYARLGLIGNVYGVAFILAALNMPLSVMLMRTFFLNIPIEIEEAAKVDGASTQQLLVKIMLPMVFPGVITVATLAGLNAWNEFLISSTFLQGAKNFTATLSYLSFNYVFSADQGMMMAGALIIIVPIIVFFLALQKYVVDGLVAGAVKG